MAHREKARNKDLREKLRTEEEEVWDRVEMQESGLRVGLCACVPSAIGDCGPSPTIFNQDACAM